MSDAHAPRPSPGRGSSPGWVLLPQRVFLGGTFTFAGLQKLADPRFFDSSRPTSFAGQLSLFRATSPIRALLGPVAAHPGLFGVMIALAEVAVGVGTLLGLWSRLAALGGALLSLSFLLTVSWATRPYYYGSDIVFLAAWVPLVWVGSAGVLSLDAALARQRVRGPVAARAGEPAGLDRRVATTGLVGAGVLLLAAADAGLGRLLGRRETPPHVARTATPTGRATPRPSPSGSTPVTAGTAVGRVADLPVGGALAFTEPVTGAPAYVVQPARDQYLAFSAICTHAGCTVAFFGDAQRFRCPCHGAVYDGRTGTVQAGPAPAPLRRIPVTVVGDELRVSA